MASSDNVQQQQQPPFPSTVNAANSECTKLRFDSTGTNYKDWKEQMLRFANVNKMYQLPPPETGADDGKLRGWILCWLNDDVVRSVSALKTSRDIWLKLEWKSEPYFYIPSDISDPPLEEARRDYEQEHLDYLLLYRAAHQGDWEAAKRTFDRHGGSGTNLMKKNVLHAAAATGKSNHFVEELINEMPPRWITSVHEFGDTVLTTAVTTGNIQLAKSLVTEIPALLYIKNEDGNFPLQIAAAYAEREILDYLILVTKSDNDFGVNPYTGVPGLRLLLYVIEAEYLDIALSLVEKYPELATLTHPEDKSSALKKISSKKSIFCSDGRFTFWERFISSGLIKSIKGKTTLKLQALELVKHLCEKMESLGFEKAIDIYFDACVVAAEHGVHEVVEEIVQVVPNALFFVPKREPKKSLFHVAVENRSEHVYNLLCQVDDNMRLSLLGDSDGNNVFHLAGKLAPSKKLDEISGAALQMQYEMQWYKELEKFGNPQSREGLNNANKSPKMVFTEEHKQLKEDGEKWMKDTANSCTIAAALIATVMFAAAITVPGGHDSSNGFPIFSNNAVFIVFAISDAVSLFTSATSLLMFLAILTSRYAEEDFLYVLPKRLIIGLGTLFLSITFMMLAFSATIYLVFGQQKAWVLIPVGGLACLPVASFVLLQFPLLFDLISSTYGSGMFRKQRTSVKIRPWQIRWEH